ncbi:MAG: hypothetical protein C4555_05940 [Dehalococcoidia bacterium]|jgi:hypothetical protein|nr:MAG: hypothetical protein C4555_05940 [Dehalococcoidia bacterium]
MRKTIVITDLTQMPREFSNGNEVCVVGLDEDGNSVRLICNGGFQKNYLKRNHLAIVRPSAKVEFDLHVIKVNPPHIEDMGFNPDSITGKGFCTNAEWERALQQTSFDAVEDIFEGHLSGNDWVLPGTETRSIATLSGARIVDIELTGKNAKPRVTFVDKNRRTYCRPVSDLTLWNRCYSQVIRQHKEPKKVAEELKKTFQESVRLYLRLGLARPWAEDNKCWLQVTGIYTFPDYLKGKTFADF